MALVTHVDVEVRPSIGFQTVGYTARVQFDSPLEAVEALARVAEVRDLLTEQAHADLEVLVKQRQQAESGAAVTAASAAPVPQAAAPTTGVDGWQVGNKPGGKGSFRYLATSAYPIDRFKSDALALVREAGIDPESVDVWDDRTGKYGLESGNEGYTPGKVKVKDGTSLSRAMGDKSIVGGIEFNNDGTIRFALSRDGKAAVQALAIASNLKSMDAVPF